MTNASFPNIQKYFLHTHIKNYSPLNEYNKEVLK